MKAKYRLVFNRKKKLNNEGKAQVLVEIYFDRQNRTYVKTKVFLFPNQWDPKKQLVKNHENYIYLNQFLSNFISNIESKELESINKGEIVNTENIHILINEEKEKQKRIFNEFYASEIENEKKI